LESDLIQLLDQKLRQFSQPDYISLDPVSIPHLFSKKEDIEIAGFLTATIAWGQRPVILKNAGRLLKWMDFAPYDFISNFREVDLRPFMNFVHRTFNGIDCVYFIRALQHIYRNGGLEKSFSGANILSAISSCRSTFFSLPHELRTEKHFSNPAEGAAAKRLNMFLRWMVREDPYGVDFGLWKSLKPSMLICPLDVHSGRVARNLGLLHRKQNDWKAALELTDNLRRFDAQDPVKYDLALYGIGAFEKYKYDQIM
jgi:uncharacterized protein (TIGR02757 family)